MGRVGLIKQTAAIQSDSTRAHTAESPKTQDRDGCLALPKMSKEGLVLVYSNSKHGIQKIDGSALSWEMIRKRVAKNIGRDGEDEQG